ncbi:MAG: ATP-binding protein [Bradymonadia bacterium]
MEKIHMHFDNPPQGDHPPMRTEETLHACYRRLFTLVKSAHSLLDITRSVTMTFQGLFGAAGAAMCHVVDDTARFVTALGSLSHIQEAKIDFNMPIVANFLAHGQCIARSRAQLSNELLSLALYSPFESILIAPIKVGEAPIGFIALVSDTPDFFSPVDAGTFGALTTYLSMLIETRERDVCEQIRIQDERIGSTCTKIAPQLHQATINLIQTFATLRKHYVAQKYTLMAEPLAAAVNNIEQMAKSTQGMRTLSEICEASAKTLSPMAIAPVIENVVDYNRSQIDDMATLELHVAEGLPEVYGDFTLIWQSIHELIQNALRALKGTEAPRLTLRAYPHPYRVVIEVCDNGCGIEPADVPNIFDPFFTRWSSLGLGLTRARLNILKIGGQLIYGSSSQPGSTFKIYLPDEQHRPQIEVF